MFTLETDYPFETGYPLDNSGQTLYVLIWNGMVLILDGQSAWLYSPVFPSILTDFEDGLSVTNVKTAHVALQHCA